MPGGGGGGDLKHSPAHNHNPGGGGGGGGGAGGGSGGGPGTPRGGDDPHNMPPTSTHADMANYNLSYQDGMGHTPGVCVEFYG